MLNLRYYQIYYEQLFAQVFMILNAMFVLFLAMDHDQRFLAPFIAYFQRFRVSLAKYIFHMWIIVLYIFNVYILYQIVFEIFLPISVKLDIMMFIDLSLDLFMILNSERKYLLNY